MSYINDIPETEPDRLNFGEPSHTFRQYQEALFQRDIAEILASEQRKQLKWDEGKDKLERNEDL